MSNTPSNRTKTISELTDLLYGVSDCIDGAIQSLEQNYTPGAVRMVYSAALIIAEFQCEVALSAIFAQSSWPAA